MLLKDSMVPLRGEVLLRVLDKNGRCLYRHHDKNSITYLAPLVLMDLMVQSDFDDDGTAINIEGSHPADTDRGFAVAQTVVSDPQKNVVRYMRVGTGDSPAARADTDLVAPLDDQESATALISSITFPTNSSIKFVATFAADKANAEDPIAEVSLWTRGSALSLDPVGTSDSRMFARQAHPPVTKTEAIMLEYSWTIFLT
jgi:hypothetical protein